MLAATTQHEQRAPHDDRRDRFRAHDDDATAHAWWALMAIVIQMDDDTLAEAQRLLSKVVPWSLVETSVQKRHRKTATSAISVFLAAEAPWVHAIEAEDLCDVNLLRTLVAAEIQRRP